MASVAFSSHLELFLSSARDSVPKNLGVLGEGWPSGSRRPAATKSGISCGLKPRYHAASEVVKRAGGDSNARNEYLSSLFIARVFEDGEIFLFMD